MDENERKEFYEDLKKIGFKLEYEINEWIKEKLNHEKVIQGASMTGKYYADMLNKLHQYIHMLSLQLNFPTKDDVANTAKLIIQTEEKIDGLEEQIFQLTEKVESLKKQLNEPKEEKKPAAAEPKDIRDSVSILKDELFKQCLSLSRWKDSSDFSKPLRQNLIRKKRRRGSNG